MDGLELMECVSRSLCFDGCELSGHKPMENLERLDDPYMLCSISLSVDQFCFCSNSSQVFYIHVIFVFGVWCSIVASISSDLIYSLILEGCLGLLVLQADVFMPLGIGNPVKRHLFPCVMNRNALLQHFSNCFKCY